MIAHRTNLEVNHPRHALPASASPASGFHPFPPFHAHPLLPCGHLQTVVGAYLPQKKAVHAAATHYVELADGDIVVMHDQQPARWQAGDPIALMVHGLGGAGESLYMIRIADRLCTAGVRAFRLNLRGCGPGINLAKNPCHAGRSEDAQAALDYIAGKCPGSPVSLIGFSMGGNIVLKLAGEIEDAVPENLAQVIAVAPPIDLASCCENMRSGWNRLYDRSFVRGLNRLVARRLKEAPHAEHVVLPKSPCCLYEFDNCITAPLAGYANAEEYYRCASAAPLLKQIQAPTLIIAADDDPLIPPRIFDSADMASTVEYHLTRGGGHLGYVARASDDPDSRWLDWRIVEQVVSIRRRFVKALPLSRRAVAGRISNTNSALETETSIRYDRRA